jgi:acetyl esterase/lipase
VETARASGAALEVIEVPGGQHGFDGLDHTEESRAAVAQAMTWVAGALRER